MCPHLTNNMHVIYAANYRTTCRFFISKGLLEVRLNTEDTTATAAWSTTADRGAPALTVEGAHVLICVICSC